MKFYKRDSQGPTALERVSCFITVFLALIFVFTCGTASAEDFVGLVDSQKVIFSHPKFDETARTIILLGRPLDGNPAQILSSETDPERRRIITTYSVQAAEFAELDRAIAAEKDQAKRDSLQEDRRRKLDELEETLMAPIVEECKTIMQAVMTLNKMTVLLELDSAYYGGTDITEDVIQRIKGSL